MDFQDFPFLNADEFAEVCHHFESLYCRATLGPLRKRWKLRLCTALNTSMAAGVEYTTYLQITRPLEATLDHDDLSSHIDKFSFNDTEKDEAMEEDTGMAQAEDADEAALRTQPESLDVGHVIYEIHLHPTYRVPCLWFSLHGLPPDEPAFNIDTVFRRLVPDQFKDGLRRMGSIGGISGDHHPLTGVPSFFVHPCLIGDQLAGFQLTKKSYLMAWLGLVGGCVGLWAPIEMAID